MSTHTRDVTTRVVAGLLALLAVAGLVLAVHGLAEYAASDSPLAAVGLLYGGAVLLFGLPALCLTLPVVAEPRRHGFGLAAGVWTTAYLAPATFLYPQLAPALLAALTLTALATAGLARDRAGSATPPGPGRPGRSRWGSGPGAPRSSAS